MTFHGIESKGQLILLDTKCICAAPGVACLADSDEPSHVIKARSRGVGSVEANDPGFA
jgi:cysteine sulfinate desulfinase/cysteine desulfurase-like protein